ncbi:hypothetical protein [Adhaeribacter pallidiroseus]|uniref:Uncharacterized protein n=1 Tax=Adhaeribacter pallidiroseus TaxID=2072847 RepID=A0A369QJB0_9BACT|nr:hypothetical protein [Adhaeribacter pallidiroseus]RDC63316.1 hypothetical protein AHMF7616_01918 [Adhaeribacter pallidiroseus]
MRTVEISVKDQDFSRLQSILKQLDFIEAIKEKEKTPISETALLSEQALAEDWDSEEDSRYEQLYKNTAQGTT